MEILASSEQSNPNTKKSPMALTKAIRFRHLADQLKPFEFNQLKPLILDLLFSYIFTNLKTSSADNINQIDDFIQIISNIIKSRNNEPIQPQNIHINELNSNVIGTISSYLNQIDYTRFSMTTRSILIGCNSPNTLQQINLDSFNIPYRLINLQLHSSVKYLEFNAQKCHEIDFILNNVEHILNNVEHVRMKDFLLDKDSSEKFMKGDIIKFENIKALEWFVPYHKQEPGGLLEFLSKFKMIEYLELDECFDVSFVGIETAFPNLKSFCSNGSEFGNSIINKYSHQLQALKFADSECVILAENSKFDKLVELTVFGAFHSTINQILRSTKCLQKFRMSCKLEYDVNAVQKMIGKVISRQLSLYYMDITCNHKQFEGAFNGIEKGLFKVKKQKKKYFKSKVRIECKKEINLNDTILHLSRIKNVLKLSNLNDFMLLCVLYGDKKPDKNEIDTVVKDYLDCESGVMIYTVDEYENNGSMIVITNNNCGINGYSET